VQGITPALIFTEYFIMKKKWIVACLALGCSSLFNANASNLVSDGKCESITPQNYTEFMESDIARAVKNPFSNNDVNKPYYEDYCMNMSFKAHDTPNLAPSDFGNSEKVYKAYEEFIKGENGLDQANITMNYDPDTKQVFTFFKFPADGDVAVNYQKYWSKNKLLMMHYEDFIFLHELMHTDVETTMSDMERNEKESIVDIASVIVLQSAKELSPDMTYTIMKQLDRARKTRVPINHPRKREVDHNHLHKSNFSEALDFFDKIRDNDVSLRITSFKEARDIAMNIVNNGYEYAYQSAKEKSEKDNVLAKNKRPTEEATLGM